jgi:hypothetical protein
MDNIKTNAFYILSLLTKGDKTLYTTPTRLFYLIFNRQFTLFTALILTSMETFKQVGK